jgi:NAD(P)-dependent dehydrogenase (short-subunit alcohol dehydrogenase family)
MLGIYHPGKDWLDVPPDQFDDTMSVNVRVPFFASQWVAKRLIAVGETGAIVSTASVAGQRGSAVAEYGASKAAVINLTKSLRTRLGRHGIRVNAIAPGLINTAMGARVPQAAKDAATASALGRSGDAASALQTPVAVDPTELFSLPTADDEMPANRATSRRDLPVARNVLAFSTLAVESGGRPNLIDKLRAAA